MAMDTRWLVGLTGEARELRKKEILRHKGAFNDLKEFLEKHFVKKEAVRDYDLPNWELRQIAVNEYNQALMDILKVISNLEE